MKHIGTILAIVTLYFIGNVVDYILRDLFIYIILKDTFIRFYIGAFICEGLFEANILPRRTKPTEEISDNNSQSKN